MKKKLISSAIVLTLLFCLAIPAMAASSGNVWKTAFADQSYGSTAKEVYVIQRVLQNLSYGITYVDGIFGQNTETGVESFQDDENLGIDGIVGDNTWDKLQSKAVYHHSDGDYAYYRVNGGAGLCQNTVNLYWWVNDGSTWIQIN